MSHEGVVNFVTRVMEDEGFRAKLQANPDATLAQFDLTAEEIAAIKSADPAKLEDLGVDERVTKTTIMATAAQSESLSIAQLLHKLFLTKA